MWDTTDDFRILLAEKSLKYLENTLQNARFPGQWDRRGALTTLRRIASTLQTAKYSYMSPRDLASSDLMKGIQRGAVEIVNCLGGEGWAEKFLGGARREERSRIEEHISRIRFSLNVLYNLPARLSLGEISEPAYAVDIRAARVLSATHHPDDRDLTICRVSVGRAITVITNVRGVEEGVTYALSLLPPRRIKGVLSEGMFLGNQSGLLRTDESEGTFLTGVDEDYLNEVRAQVLAFLKG